MHYYIRCGAKCKWGAQKKPGLAGVWFLCKRTGIGRLRPNRRTEWEKGLVIRTAACYNPNWKRPQERAGRSAAVMNDWILVWLGAMVLFGAVEAATVGLVSVWFAIGAAAALGAALAGWSVTAQILTFALVSALALALTRPLLRHMSRRGTVPTNADRVLGMTVRVTERIDNGQSSGAVYADGKTWTARSADGSVIPEGEQVRILSMEGVTLHVEACEKQKGATR